MRREKSTPRNGGGGGACTWKGQLGGAEIGCVASPPTGSEAWRRLRGSSCKDELQGSLDVPPGGLQGAEAQLVVMDAHVSQLLQLGLPLALRGESEQRKGHQVKHRHGTRK